MMVATLMVATSGDGGLVAVTLLVIIVAMVA